MGIYSVIVGGLRSWLYSPPVPSSTHCSLHPFPILDAWQSTPPPFTNTHSLRTLQSKKAPGVDARGGWATGVLWNAENVETIGGGEIWTFQSPEVTKGFHPGSVGRGGRQPADSGGRLSIRKTTAS